MDRIWQWAWDRYKTRYSWGLYALAIPMYLPIYLLPSLAVVASEKSDRYADLVDRGSHALQGKSAAIRVFGLEPVRP